MLRRPFAPTKSVLALSAVDLDAAPGQVLGLLGPNGAGKSTLLKVVANLVRPSQGHVEVAGHDLASNPLAIRRAVGWIPSEERSFFFRLTGRENLRFFAATHGIPRRLADRRIDEHLERFELREQAEQRFDLCSSGRRKLFTIIRGLLHEPQVLILDEPTNSLDPPTARTLQLFVRDELARARNLTIVWATHRLEEVRDICDRTLMLHHGGVRFDGEVAAFEAFAADQSTGDLFDAFDALLRGPK